MPLFGNKKKTVEKKSPRAPGEVLLERYLRPRSLSINELAKHIREPIEVIRKIIEKRSRISPEHISFATLLLFMAAHYHANYCNASFLGSKYKI